MGVLRHSSFETIKIKPRTQFGIKYDFVFYLYNINMATNGHNTNIKNFYQKKYGYNYANLILSV